MSLLKAGSLLKQWNLRNEDTGSAMQGQFAAKIGMEVRNNWHHHTALSRSRAVTMFINSEVDRITVPSMFYARDATGVAEVQTKIELLLEWCKPNQAEQRPPVLTFWVGNGFLEKTCVLAGISDIQYGEPTVLGALREVSFVLNLDAYSEFKINETAAYETRYHRTRTRDYYEMLCWREYKQPMLGDVIRKRHPAIQQVIPGQIIKLPSIEAIRTSKIEPTSTALATSFGRKDTPQRSLRIEYFNRRDKKYTSHIAR